MHIKAPPPTPLRAPLITGGQEQQQRPGLALPRFDTRLHQLNLTQRLQYPLIREYALN